MRPILSPILSIIKSKKIYQFSLEIIYSNLIRILSRLFNKEVNNNLIIMGAYGGNAFSDNSKYVYLYLREHTNFDVYWISKNIDLYRSMVKQGYKVLSKFSLNAIKYLRKARFIFITHGIHDILPIEFAPDTKIISMWHGALNKRNITEHGPLYFSKLARFFKLHIVNDFFIDFYVTASGTLKDKKLIVKYFQISPNKIIATGFPRNDILFTKDPSYLESLKIKFNIPQNTKKLFLYAPTFRDDSFVARFPLSKEELNDLNEYLKKDSSLLIMKAHMFEQSIEFEEYSNIKLSKKEADIQELLTITDVLITDYSSVYCDFLLLNRPILLFTYDYDEFMSQGRGFYYDFREIAPGPMLYTAEDLIKAIKNIDKIGKEYEEKRIETRKIYQKHVDGKSTERLLKFLGII